MRKCSADLNQQGCLSPNQSLGKLASSLATMLTARNQVSSRIKICGVLMGKTSQADETQSCHASRVLPPLSHDHKVIVTVRACFLQTTEAPKRSCPDRVHQLSSPIVTNGLLPPLRCSRISGVVFPVESNAPRFSVWHDLSYHPDFEVVPYVLTE